MRSLIMGFSAATFYVVAALAQSIGFCTPEETTPGGAGFGICSIQCQLDPTMCGGLEPPPLPPNAGAPDTPDQIALGYCAPGEDHPGGADFGICANPPQAR